MTEQERSALQALAIDLAGNSVPLSKIICQGQFPRAWVLDCDQILSPASRVALQAAVKTRFPHLEWVARNPLDSISVPYRL